MAYRASNEQRHWNSLFEPAAIEQELEEDQQPQVLNIPPPPNIEGDKIEWRHCKLPVDQKESERRFLEDDDAGILDVGYRCELCRVGNMANDPMIQVSQMLAKIYEMDSISYQHVPKRTRYESMASEYNKTIYMRNSTMIGKRKKDIVKWTMPMVRYHMEVCDKSKPERSIDKDVELLDIVIEEIRENGLMKQKIVNGDEKEMELDKYNFDKLLKAMLAKARLITVKEGLLNPSKRQKTSNNDQEEGGSRGKRPQQAGGRQNK